VTAERHDVLCISSIDWDFIWQGHQEIMSTLAAQGHRVLFVENTGARRPALRDLPRLRHRIRNWLRGVKGFRRERDNLFVYSPLLLPFPYSRLAGWLNAALLRRSLRRWMRAIGFGRPVVWVFLPTPLARHVIREVDPLLTVYYCLGDIAASSAGARRIRDSEERLLADSDLVFVDSRKQHARMAGLHPRAHFFPFGVAYGKFEKVRLAPDDVPADLRELRRPVVGYVGGLHRWFDQDLVAAVAARMPEVTFALVGPAQTDVSRLARQPNVRLLGARDHTDIPRYIKGFDVAIVPYVLSEYTTNVYPTKLNEYLAMGVPVVATDLPEIRLFNAEHGGIVAVAGEPETFISSVEQALGATADADVSRRVAVARENSWETRIARMGALIEAELAAKRESGERWEYVLRRLYRRARRRLSFIAGGTVLAYLLLFYTPLVWWLGAPLQVAAPPARADAVVVFAGGVGESGKAGGGYQERVKQAVDLYQAGYAPLLVFSSGYTAVFREAEVMRDLAIWLKVPASAIVLETHAADTRDNVRFTADIVRTRGARRVLLVSSPYHMRRAVLTWRHLAPDVEALPSPPPYSQFYRHAWGASLEQIRGIGQEYAAIVWYWWKGWL
jgi:uncharacterized SAM-binding protein YcdF (DUF218 family)/glycosyltransferase involved in cell wall biosynthesis